jgi:hypothetical protein
MDTAYCCSVVNSITDIKSAWCDVFGKMWKADNNESVQTPRKQRNVDTLVACR